MLHDHSSKLQLLKWRFLAMALLTTLLATPGYAARLVSDPELARLGLQRAWFAQVQVDASRHRVVKWLHDKDRVFALTSGGMIQALDAETGETIWQSELGLGHAPAAGLAVNSQYVALLGSSRLFVMDRNDGHHLWSRSVGGAAAAAPALSDTHAYVVMLNGRVEGYPLKDPTAYIWQYQSNGRIYLGPTTTGSVVSWPTDKGMLYVGRANDPRVLFRVETNDEIVTAPAERDPYLYVASLDGYLYCFNEMSGAEQWRYATGFAITSQPAIVGDKAFVASEGPTLHAVEALTGRPLWQVGGAAQFVALGQRYTYGMDRFGSLIAIDNQSGGVAGRLITGESNQALVNDKSDRIFLISADGLVQCLHEIGADEPTWHREQAQTEAETEAQPAEGTTSEGAASTPAAEAEQPSDSPFEAEEESDFGAFDDSNPFE